MLIAFFNFNVIIDIVGFVYPFIASISALQTEDKADDEQWLTYWIVFALFKMFESILDTFISFIPFYHWLKVSSHAFCILSLFFHFNFYLNFFLSFLFLFLQLSFLTFCWYPRGNDADPGATLIYKKIIAVYIAPHVTSLMDSTVKKKE